MQAKKQSSGTTEDAEHAGHRSELVSWPARPGDKRFLGQRELFFELAAQTTLKRLRKKSRRPEKKHREQIEACSEATVQAYVKDFRHD